jgi:hypothetical protein
VRLAQLTAADRVGHSDERRSDNGDQLATIGGPQLLDADPDALRDLPSVEEQQIRYAISSSSALASFRSAVSKPSVNQS